MAAATLTTKPCTWTLAHVHGHSSVKVHHYHLHEFIVLPDGFRDLWFGDSDGLYLETSSHAGEVLLESCLQVLVNLV